ncbi:MAG: AMP-binding protein [Pseudomonadota bacterium]
MADLISTFRAVAEAKAGATALIDNGRAVSFEALWAQAARFSADCRARGLRRGDRVLLAMPIGADLFAALAGAWGAGLTVVFPEPAMGFAGLRHAVAVTEPKALIATGAYRFIALLQRGLRGKPVLWPDALGKGSNTGLLGAADPTDIALISFTSGATGAPKAIPRSHAFLMAQNAAVAPVLEGDAVDLVAFPVFTLINLAAGRCSVLPNWRLSRPDRVTPDALAALIKSSGAARALLPPALCATLAKANRPGDLHTVFTGGGPVKPSLVADLQARGLRVVSVYGSTEAEPIAELDWSTVTDADISQMVSGGGLLAGKPVDGLQLRLNEAEIEVAGAHVNPGYLDPAHDATTKRHEAGVIWHRTGDAGRLDETGRLWLFGRAAEVQTTESGTLYPFAIELAAEAWPGVARAALTARKGKPVLAIEGDPGALLAWRDAAAALGVAEIMHLAAIPMDRRHRSKVDYTALASTIGS